MATPTVPVRMGIPPVPAATRGAPRTPVRGTINELLKGRAPQRPSLSRMYRRP